MEPTGVFASLRIKPKANLRRLFAWVGERRRRSFEPQFAPLPVATRNGLTRPTRIGAITALAGHSVKIGLYSQPTSKTNGSGRISEILWLEILRAFPSWLGGLGFHRCGFGLGLLFCGRTSGRWIFRPGLAWAFRFGFWFCRFGPGPRRLGGPRLWLRARFGRSVGGHRMQHGISLVQFLEFVPGLVPQVRVHLVGVAKSA